MLEISLTFFINTVLIFCLNVTNQMDHYRMSFWFLIKLPLHQGPMPVIVHSA